MAADPRQAGDPRPRILWVWSPKGGCGTSTVAASVAIRVASRGREVVLVDLAGDQAALLGVITADDAGIAGIGDWLASDMSCGSLSGLVEELAPGLGLLRLGTRSVADASGAHPERDRLLSALKALADPDRVVVVDAGLDPHLYRAAEPVVAVCVIRNCYMALHRARNLAGPYDRVVVIEEPQRALGTRDLVRALGADKVEGIAWDQRVARAVDAGTIVSRLPLPLSSGLDGIMGLCGASTRAA